MKRDTLFEKLEIILIVEALIVILAMVNAPTAKAERPDAGVHVPVNMHQP